jgi:hypothetical protein
MNHRDESLTQLPQSSDYRHTIDVLQAKVWLFQSTTVGALVALALMVFSR